ncbi:RHS repeat-associated core domain-containing protein, partial [Flavobacterium sp. NKUCC04_CG]|uniref:RHS repeat-associated core domain-containing protein n=1 Tax=Flavobacterium sp. NKUCC04_CG TaxID=2842121 RepID=UPI001C5A6847
YKFNAKELDAATGMYYYGARYYDPSTSIFLSVDPLAEKYPNYGGYIYVMNNPINAIDPDGREVVFVVGGTRYNFNGTNLTNNKGQIVNVKASSHAGRILNAYISLSKLDPHFKGQIKTLVGSKNTHMINTDQLSSSGGSVKGGNEFDSASTTADMEKTGKSMGSITRYNFSEAKSKEIERSTGVSGSDITTVAHELQHQYDYEKGNMADSYGMESSNTNPAEIRGVNNENIARDKLNMSQRTKYGGKEINPKELKK